MMKELSDTELIQNVRAGHRTSFSELVKRYQKSLLRLSLRFVKDLDAAQDVVQESFIKAYEKLESFEGRASFKSWLYQITVNTAKNKIRDRKEMTEVEEYHWVAEPTAERDLIQDTEAKEIQKAIETLPHKQKTALMLRIYEDLSFKEIAEIMDCPYDTAKANYRHALMKLRHQFESESSQQWASWFPIPAEVEL